MCGIAGILTSSSSHKIQEHSIKQMLSALHHRGLDDRGMYFSSCQQAAFVHTRLSILDLSDAGHQPMSRDRYWITFNGEIYNFLELRQELELKGYQFKSKTDTEVILYLYQHYGDRCVEHLRGMFAFAIWDDLEKTCFMARDPLGIKPFYYWQKDNVLVFASELRTVLASGLPEVKLDFQGLYGYLTLGSVPEPYTLIEQIRCLPAGHWLKWQSGQIQHQQYWQVDFTPENIDLTEAIAITRQALLDSIHYHHVSDVPVGIFLSGGIDSTAILALSRQVQTGDLRTFSITFDESKWNEGDIARQTAQTFATNHTEYKITGAIAKELLPKFLTSLDQPTIDGFNTFCVSRIAHEHGMKVVLSGLGGDELFGGYKSFQTVPNIVRWRSQLGALQSPLEFLGKGIEQFATSPKIKRIGTLCQTPNTSESAYRAVRAVFSHQEALQIICQYLPDAQFRGNLLTPPDININFPTLEDEVSYLEINRYMRNQLLRDSDVMSMRWGLELRVPFVDRQLLEAIAPIPSNLRLQAGKKLLVAAVPELPKMVINRAKQGFMFPFTQWLDREWQNELQNIKAPNQLSLSSEFWYRRWSLFALQHWWSEVKT